MALKVMHFAAGNLGGLAISLIVLSILYFWKKELALKIMPYAPIFVILCGFWALIPTYINLGTGILTNLFFFLHGFIESRYSSGFLVSFGILMVVYNLMILEMISYYYYKKQLNI